MLNALRRLRVRIATLFYNYGKRCTENTVANILATTIIVLLLSIPAVSWYSSHRAAEYYRGAHSSINTYFWDSPYHISSMQGTKPPYTAPTLSIQQVHFIAADSQITKRLLKQTLEFQNRLMDTTAVTAHGKTVSMADICYQVQGRCLVHSPLDVWDNNMEKLMQDIDITGTIVNTINKKSARSGLTLHPITLFGNATLDTLGQPVSADSVMITFLLREGPLRQKYREEWNAIWNRVAEDEHVHEASSFEVKPGTPFFHKPDVEIEQYQYKYNSESIPLDSEIWILLITYAIIFVIVAVAFGNVQLVKSKYGLALAAVFETVACLTATLGIFKLTNLSFAQAPWYMISLVVIVATIENVFVFTNAMLHAGCDMQIKEKVGRGLESLGFAISATLLAELAILAVGTGTGLQTVREYCQFIGIALIIDYILQLTFFVSVLSVDIRRVELTDLGDRTISKRVHLMNSSSDIDDLDPEGEDASNYCPAEVSDTGRPNCAACKDFKTHRAMTALVICSSILLLSFLSPPTVDPENSISMDHYAQMESISSNFWNVVNPTYGVRFVEVRSPLLVALDPSEETFEHLKELNVAYETVSTAKRAHESEMESQSSLQRFTFQLIRRMVHIVLHINIPSVLILMTLIGIIMWMLPPYRQGFLEPMFQTFLARYGKYLVLAYISPKIPWAPLQRALKASKAAEYDKDGNHRGAISLQEGKSKRQNTALGELRIVTLDGHHTGDIQSMHTSSSHGTLVTAGREGELVLWDGVRGKWVARLDRVQRRKDTKSTMGDINPEYMVGSFAPHVRFSPGPVRKVAISSPVRCIRIDQANQWVACGHENGAIRIWNVSSSSWTRELNIPNMTNSSASSIKLGLGLDDSSSNSSEVPTHRGQSHTRQVVALAFIESFIPDTTVSDMPKLSRKQFSGKTNVASASSTTYLVAAYNDGYLREWDIEAGECVNTIVPDKKISISHLLVVPSKMKTRHDRHKIFVVTKEGIVKCYGRKSADAEDLNQISQWKSLYTIEGHRNQAISAIATESAVDGTGVVVTGTKKGAVQAWNFSNGVFLCGLAEGQVQKHQANPNKLSVRMPTRDESLNAHGQFSSMDDSDERKQWNEQGDHHGAVNHITISRHCRSDRVNTKHHKFEQCHRSEYLVASSSTDGIVNVWRLTSNTNSGFTDRCDQCGFGRNHFTFKHHQPTSPGYKTDEKNDIMLPKPQLQPNGTRHEFDNNQATSTPENGDGDPFLQLSSEFLSQDVPDIEQLAANTEEFQVKKSFLGRVHQQGGFGAVWLRNTVLAGVRRTNTRQNKGSKLGWELWMAPIRKHQPNRRQRHKDPLTQDLFQDSESKYNIPILTVNLDDDSDSAEQNQEPLGLVTSVLTRVLTSNAIPNKSRHRQASVTKARRMSAVATARLQRTRRKQRNSSVMSPKPDFDMALEEELSARELLPFSNLTCIDALDGDGLAFDFGNFIKVIWLDEMHQAYAGVNEKDLFLEHGSRASNSLRTRRVAADEPSTTDPSVELYSNDYDPLNRRRRSSSFSALPSQRLLPCGVPNYGQCRPGSCGPSCKPEQPLVQQYSSHLVGSKKFN
ncbi:hypothetical protein INT43_006270 [Umbelopsis isabellina]|uniref:Sterol regulatory element-binding protein cleavage-activating protein n=1 Tax=Mortierella isabellina TaxID=91625 RepID=A0A8H7PZZ5_MORIS|nr:hypothetical protein INT43_006270 [Umbelopsis isabellina]